MSKHEEILSKYENVMPKEGDSMILVTKENALKAMQEAVDAAFIARTALASEGDGWIELKEGCEMPDYDKQVLWLFEDGNMAAEALDKDGNPWLFKGGEIEGFQLPRATHWRHLPSPPQNSKK